METLKLTLDNERGYPIHIGANILDNAEMLRRHLSVGPHAVITNETIAPLYLKTINTLLKDDKFCTIIIPDGEEYKTLDTFNTITTQLLEFGIHRQSTLIALGGGVIGDVVGFVAACYQRGIPFMQIPTTLLAQVDSSVGGKTAVNHPLGKNMIGAFHQPCAVIIDSETLDSLPDRHYRAGLAEVIKYGVSLDEQFFAFLESNASKLLTRDKDVLHEAIKRSCLIKSDVVSRDECERGDIRMLLNFGHTFGHAVETGLGHGTWLHGEAISCGMQLATQFSHALDLIDKSTVERVNALLQAVGLPTKLPVEMTPQRMLSLMARDKKNIGAGQRLILLRCIGDAFVESQCCIDTLQIFLTDLAAISSS